MEIANDLDLENIIEINGGWRSRAIALRGDVCDVKILEAFRSLEDYPLLDDFMHSDLECEAQTEAWISWVEEEFISKLENKFDVEFNHDHYDWYELFYSSRFSKKSDS